MSLQGSLSHLFCHVAAQISCDAFPISLFPGLAQCRNLQATLKACKGSKHSKTGYIKVGPSDILKIPRDMDIGILADPKATLTSQSATQLMSCAKHLKPAAIPHLIEPDGVRVGFSGCAGAVLLWLPPYPKASKHDRPRFGMASLTMVQRPSHDPMAQDSDVPLKGPNSFRHGTPKFNPWRKGQRVDSSFPRSCSNGGGGLHGPKKKSQGQRVRCASIRCTPRNGNPWAGKRREIPQGKARYTELH